jgi:putative ABC transport system permease protein
MTTLAETAAAVAANAPHVPAVISPGQLVIAAGLVVVAGLTSFGLRLRLERSLAIAAGRTVVQLLLVGYVLRWVFAAEWLVTVLSVALVMVLAATLAAVHRSAWTYRGALWRALLTQVLAALLTTFVVTRIIIGVEPWYEPVYFIPLLGMVLGNTLTGLSLCLDALLDAAQNRRAEIEQDLALGATRWEAARDHIAEAVRRGMIPTINAMTVVGIVSLPGMMTGQILAGQDPVQAVKYQIVVMFMIAAAASLGCVGLALLTFQRLFTPDHQLRDDVVRRR